jgi:uncharacterized protein (UPF0276 family)
MRRIGVGHRRPLDRWIRSRPPGLDCLELTAEHFFDAPERAAELGRLYPTMVHGLGLSLGSPGPLDPATLGSFARVAEAAGALWVSEHVAFTRTPDVDLGHLNPVRPDAESLAVLADHAMEVASVCRRPLILENITSHLRLEGTMSEPEFLNRLCDRAGCGLLLDVTNLYINSRNHGFDPVRWLRELEPRRIVQLHVVGYSRRDGRFEDLHAEPAQNEILDLLEETLAYAPVRAVIIERDENIPRELGSELEALRA